jgi:hypothetical protein
VWIKITSDSSRGHKISTRNGSVNGSDLTYSFLEYWIAFSQGVFVSKNQTKVTYRLQLRVRDAALPPLYFRLQSSPLPRINKPHPLVPSLAASTMARSGGGTGNKNLNFKLGHSTMHAYRNSYV